MKSNEKKLGIKIKEISRSNETILVQAAELITKYSWGEGYPVKPIDELRKAEYRIGVFEDNQLIAFGSVGRSLSPDGIDNEALWIAHAVVVPEYRGQGIFKKIYDMQMAYAKSQQGRILSCTDNPIVEKFFLANGWKKIRESKDEAGEPSVVFEWVA